MDESERIKQDYLIGELHSFICIVSFPKLQALHKAVSVKTSCRALVLGWQNDIYTGA